VKGFLHCKQCIPSKEPPEGKFLWGVAPNPTCFLKKASQKLYLPSAYKIENSLQKTQFFGVSGSKGMIPLAG
jgi:hypothetical protein